jgi:hypothetical protein
MKTIAFALVAASSGLALAGPIMPESIQSHTSDSGPVSYTISIEGLYSNDAQGSALNELLSIPIGYSSEITSMSWDMTLTTFGGSWASEAVIGFNDQIFITPGITDAFGVSSQNYSSNGVINFADLGLENIIIFAGDSLTIEFFESFVDNGGTGDAIWEPGSIIILEGFIFPTPGPLAALGLGGLIATRRKRST